MKCAVKQRQIYLRLLTSTILLVSATVCAPASESKYAFKVQVSFSEKAAAKLHALSEGIIISATYAGDPLPSQQKHTDEIGQIPLGVDQMEMPGKPGSIVVSGTKINRKRLGWIQGPILLNVNVYSARHSGPDNILSCDFFDGKLQDAIDHPISIHCSLIAENAPTMHKYE